MLVCASRGLPGQFTLDFQLQGQTKECPDKHDQSQNNYILDGRSDDDGSNNVASNQKFQPEQNRTSDILPI